MTDEKAGCGPFVVGAFVGTILIIIWCLVSDVCLIKSRLGIKGSINCGVLIK